MTEKNRGHIWYDIQKERQRQIDLWGDDQDHPDGPLGADLNSLITADDIKTLNEYWAAKGTLTWSDILLEEVFEGTEAIDDVEHLKKELIEVAAVCISWIEAINKR